MASWAQLKEGLQNVGSQLTASKAVTAELMMNVITYLAVITHLGSRQEAELAKVGADQSKITSQIVIQLGEVKEKVTAQQGAIDVLSRGGGQRGPHPGSTRGILENKSVSNLAATRTRSGTGTTGL